MPENRDDFLKIHLAELHLESARNQSYHNHKETMAWSATAFYLPAVIVFGYQGGQVLYSIFHQYSFHYAFAILLVSLSWLAFRFINMQFHLRWIAAERVMVIEQFRSLLISNPEQFETEIAKCKDEIKKEKAYGGQEPTLIQCIDKKVNRDRNLIDFLMALLPIVKSKNRLKSESPSYFVLFAATFAAIVLLFVKPNSEIHQIAPKAAEMVIVGEDKYDQLKILVQSIRDSIAQIPLASGQKSELESEIVTIEAQIASPKPKFKIINLAVSSIKSILDEAATNEPSQGFLSKLDSLTTGQ